MNGISLLVLTANLWSSSANTQVTWISHAEPITLEAAQREYDTQLNLAKKEGIPTSFAEVAAQVTSIPPNQNAALHYKKLIEFKYPSTNDFAPLLQNARDPRKLDKTAAKAVLKKYSDYISIVEAGSKLPGCDFQRNWSKGYAVLFPELGKVKYGANLLLVKVHLAATENRPNHAANELKNIFKLAKHIANEPNTISKLVACNIQVLATRSAIDLSIYYPNEPLYQEVLQTAISTWPIRNPAKEFASDFPSLLQLLQNAGNKDFVINDLGLSEEEIVEPMTVGTPAEQLMAKADIIHYFRLWKQAYFLPPGESLINSMNCSVWMNFKMVSFPVIRSIYNGLTSGVGTTRERFEGLNNKLLFTAAQRAIQARDAKGNFPKSIKTNDLIMPYTQSTVEYNSDGKKGTVSISIPGHELIGGEEIFFYTFPRTK